MNKMTLIYVKGPGNVLAGLSRTALSAESPPSGSTDEQKRAIELQQVGDLIGAEMLMRSLLEKAGSVSTPTYSVSSAEFKVPFENFGVFTDDLDPNVLKDPRSYYVDETEKKTKPLPGLTLAKSAPDSVAFSGSDLTVTLPDDVTVDTGVWVLICATAGNGPKNQVRYDVLKKDAVDKKNKKLNAPGPLPIGTYSILTLVTGYQPTVFSRPVP